jgi:hypothetical protein
MAGDSGSTFSRLSAACFPLHASSSPSERHPVMNDPEDLNDAVCADPVDDKVSWPSHAVFLFNERSRKAERVGAHAGNAVYGSAPKTFR